MSFNEYKQEVARELLDYDYTKEEIQALLNRPKIDGVLRVNYEQFSKKGTAGCEPIATASCLDMMYI